MTNRQLRTFFYTTLLNFLTNGKKYDITNTLSVKLELFFDGVSETKNCKIRLLDCLLNNGGSFMDRTPILLVLGATLAVSGVALFPAPAAATVRYLCTTTADCKACEEMHPGLCQTAGTARNSRDRVIRFVTPVPVNSSPKPVPKPTTLPDGAAVSLPK
jgi:hypothetical protein